MAIATGNIKENPFQLEHVVLETCKQTHRHRPTAIMVTCSSEYIAPILRNKVTTTNNY